MLISTDKSRILSEKLESDAGDLFCSGLFLSAKWFVFSNSASSGTHLIILPNKETAEYCAADLYGLMDSERVFFIPVSGKNIERSNYKATLEVQRTAAVNRIFSAEKEKFTVFVSYPEALEEFIPDKRKVNSFIYSVKKGDTIKFDEIKERLSEVGFEKTDFVSAPGQFSIRGSIIDIFSYTNNEPFRISFWGNEIEDIHIFNCNTQLSGDEVESVDIMSDIVSSDEECLSGIIESLPKDSVIWMDSSDMYKNLDFFRSTAAYKRVFLDIPLDIVNPEKIEFNISPQPVFNKNFEILADDVRSRIENGFKVFVYGEKQSQLDRIKSILSQNGGLIPEFVQGKNIHAGFIDNDDKVCCYSDHEIFDRFQRVSIRKSVEKTEQLTLNDLSSFNIGDYVVHIDYGVGIFGGLVKMFDDKGRAKEVVKISYKDGDVVFVSVHALQKISRFRSRDSEPPKINKLGSKTWTALKTSAKSRVKDIAKELIQLYAKRKASAGYAFSADSYMQQELESSFMFEDTPDQESATVAVKHDMEDRCPMDRLVCGDVGFGKTEIAVRAAFKAVDSGKQVAVLVPTTILALQHYNTFTERLKNFPVRVDYVSRLRTAKEISEIKKDLASGVVDIVIGTHKILGNDFGFKDLGLLIIDEEQKFGVSAKEKLRQLRTGIDTLTLTATPIPRTLQFSLLGARDLSIINTPPPNRIPVQTEIILFDEKEVRSIINYELNRGGQVFFLHNKVEELSSIAEILQRLVPDMRICVAHGQMESKVLENKILDFMRGDYDLLLCTTIIENGLDIPNANTIIINQAQNIGLSDLHQLRGRVGRSNRKAFCYLVVPPLVSITDDARRRLKAIEEFSDLGSGFNIAMQDLDIRGAGNLLGAEQSGFISDMGYETYQKILAEAMSELGVELGESTGKDKSSYVRECSVETDLPALIPDTYIDITAEKMRIYKQLDSMNSDKEIDRLRAQLEDRFGKFPEEAENLFGMVKMRNKGAALGFEKIIFKNSLFILFFTSNAISSYFKSDVFAKILQKVAEHPGLFTLKQNDAKLKIVSRSASTLVQAMELLTKLQ